MKDKHIEDLTAGLCRDEDGEVVRCIHGHAAAVFYEVHYLDDEFGQNPKTRKVMVIEVEDCISLN
jgi:hypothetical protein